MSDHQIPVDKITSLDRQLLLAVAEAIRSIDFDGTVPHDVMARLARAETDLRMLSRYATTVAT